MAIETDLSVAPYFDDTVHGIEKNYYKILFKPSLPVQVRELNELQSILQNQIEEFGDNILKKGTIVKGCSFSFYNNYPYIKIKDNQVDGTPISTSELVGKYLTSGSNHRAYVLDYADGFEQTDPDTKTLYIRYVNSGDGAANQYFQSSDVLTVATSNYSIPKVSVDVNGTGYSNSDSVVFVSAVAVTSVTGTITVGSTLKQTSTGANAIVVSVDTTTYNDKTILVVKPKPADLNDSAKSANAWTFAIGADNALVDAANSLVTAIPIETIGSGAVGTVTTDSAQRIIDVAVLDQGSGYYVAPHVGIRSFGGGSGVTLTAQNYYSRITVYNGANSVGQAYAFGISEGVIYQKGYFLKVDPQTVVVGKYTQYPNNVSVGFRTDEAVVDAYTDTRLLDNALGSRNYTAPGADRLQLVPSLIVQNTDAARANVEFFPLVEFSEGIPYKQNQRTSYSSINDEMALRTSQQTGDYVIDPFLVAVKSTSNTDLLANTFTVAVDPGQAYIDGFRTETYGTYQVTDQKGIDIDTKTSANVSLNYGSYVTVNNLAGSFNFGKGDIVKLYNTAAGYVSNTAAIQAGTIAPVGTQIGTARVRALQYIDTNPTGVPSGNPTSQYNLYLFDVRMNAGQAFTNVKSIYYDGTTYDGIADVVTQSIAVGNSTVQGAVLKSTVASDKTTLDKLLFNSGFDSPLSINNISYTYRKFDDTGTTYTMANTGVISITLSGDEYFPYNTDLTSVQKSDLIFYPLTDAVANQSISGTLAITSSNSTITGSSTAFTNDLQAGDYITVAVNSTANVIKRVVSITNATSLTVESNFAASNSSTAATRVFPKYIPLPILTRNSVTANATVDAQTLTVDLGTRLKGASSIGLGAAFNITVANAAVDDRIPARNVFVKIAVGNNTTGFGYSSFGNSASASFTSGSTSVTGSGFNIFYSGDPVVITSGGQTFNATIDTVADDNDLTLTANVNFTGSGTITRAVNSNGPWCLGIPDIFRLRAVYLANTASVNTSSFDVTREFYIDHNQNPNFYDLGYLVKNRDSALVLGPQDYLLVQFDAFKQTYPGRPVTINSYVSGNSTLRSTTDSAALSSLTSAKYDVNTLEVPEVHTPSGTDYDLISYIDFRPRVANTADYALSAGAATVNPIYDKTFSSDVKKFPTPDSILSCDVQYFLGRMDSVYVDSSGRIGISKGHPTPLLKLYSSNMDDLVTPVKNKRVMVLNNIRIPPYPSLEENMSAQQLELLDKKVINGKLLNRRTNDKKVTRLFTKTNIEINQPKGYTMEQIGNLERRISDLEYYVALSNLELQIKDLNLPSSISSSINRFKFGFFADNYDNENFSDIDSNEYRAKVENGRVHPPYENIRVVYPNTDCPYTDFAVINQPKATGASAPAICVNTAIIERKEVNASENGSKATYTDNLDLTMASALGNSSGQVAVYCYFYSAADQLLIYQSNTANSFTGSPIYTSNSSVAFTSNDVSYLQTLPWFKGISATDLVKHTTVTSPSYGLKYGGKITFNHNPAAGRYYRFATTKGPGSVVWRYRVEYPVNVDCNAANNTGNSTPTNYTGQIKVVETKEDLHSNKVVANGSSTAWLLEFDRFRLNVTGLKPATLHKVYVNKKDVTNLVDTTPSSTFVPPTQAGLTAWNTYSGTPFQPNTTPATCYVMTDTRGQLDAFLYLVEEAHIGNKIDQGGVKVTKPLLEIQTADKSSYAYTTLAKEIELFHA